MATGIEGDQLTGLQWCGESFNKEKVLSIKDLNSGAINITHYYGLSEITYNSIYSLAWHYITKIVYIKIHIYRHIDSTHQYFFNKRKLVTKTRMQLLQFLIDNQLGSTHKGIHIISLLTQIYSTRLFFHPSKDVYKAKLELYLDSLVKSGELQFVNNEYVVTGIAITTIEKYEEDERRHTEAVKIQRKMFWLTVVAVIFTIVQTGMIKLPTILDWSTSNASQLASHESLNRTLGADAPPTR